MTSHNLVTTSLGCTMMKSRRAGIAFAADFVGAIDALPEGEEPALGSQDSLRRGWVLPTTVSTSAAAVSSITAPSYMGSTAALWKRFLSRVSLMDTLSGFDLAPLASHTRK